MIKLTIIENEYQQFRLACLDNLDKDIEICYNNNIIKWKFDYNNKVFKSYTHCTQEEGAMNEVESEIFDIYQHLTLGGTKTTHGTTEEWSDKKECFIVVKDKYKMEVDTMFKGFNYEIKRMSNNIYTNTYEIYCHTCKENQFISTKHGQIPKCPRCKGEKDFPQMPIEDFFKHMEQAEVVFEGGILSIEKDDESMIVNINKNFMNEVNALVEIEEIDTPTAIIEILSGRKKAEIKKNEPTPTPKPVQKPAPKSIVKSKSKITDDDLLYVLEKIRTNFTGKSFKSRDLSPKVIDKLTARQLPSRLTQLVNKGMLEADNASPKNYKLL